jgi:D-ornithine 4,5-aminomutase subunit beta
MDVNKKLNIPELLKDLESYRPRRKGWTWRKSLPRDTQLGPFKFKQISKSLKNYVPLPAAKYFGNIDPQPECIITTEIASGRFEDDIRRMRMAAWHGADHIMVIRTAGQSHYDGLIEGSPEGIGGVPITRKQLRASRKALDIIEDEVGRPINFHSYVSGVAGPDIAVLFAEEGVNGAHQDPQYNVLYRNVNMIRSFVDAAEAKKLMASVDMLQIDGAHNANATAREAWLVMPELLVQHGINCAFSLKAGMKKEYISLSTVPPTATPAPELYLDLPYAVALRELFQGYKMRAQMNSKYMEADPREATVNHTMNLLISRLTSVDIQSTITPDEGRNVPWHYNNIAATNTAKQMLIGLDGIKDLVEIKKDGPLRDKVRELKERAILFLEEMVEVGGYFKAVEAGFFVDSAQYPARNYDGIVRHADGGIGPDSVFLRDKDYFAPVCQHYGNNNLPVGTKKACDLIQGCTLCHPEKIIYIDELDEEDNAAKRLEVMADHREKGLLRPEVEWYADGVISMQLFYPTSARVAEYAALAMAEKMGITEAEIINRLPMHPSEGTFLELKGKVAIDIDPAKLDIPEEVPLLTEEEIRADIKAKPMTIVGATVGQDEHSVGMREIIDIKHGGIEGFGITCHYLGTSVSLEKVVDAAIETAADAILISTIITHADIHRINMRKLHDLCKEKGIRDKIILISGGTQVTNDIAVEEGMDAGFGRGTHGHAVASFLVDKRRTLK